MRKILTLLLLTSVHCTCFAQRIRVTDLGNTWRMYDIECCDVHNAYQYYYVMFTESSVLLFISGHVYSSISGRSGLGISGGYIREDTVAKKVFFRPRLSHSSIDTTEHILYDYNLRVDDTIKFVSDLDYNLKEYKSWVTQVDSTQINGQWYKVWDFNWRDSSLTSHSVSTIGNYKVIEGIGCTNGVFYPVLPYLPFEFSNQLVCFEDNGNSYPLSNPVSSWGYWVPLFFDNLTSCTLSNLSLGNPTQVAKECVVSPNPITTFTKIKLPYKISTGTLTIFNSIGQVIIKTSFANKSEISIGDIVKLPGTYFYRVSDDNNRALFTGKFVRE